MNTYCFLRTTKSLVIEGIIFFVQLITKAVISILKINSSLRKLVVLKHKYVVNRNPPIVVIIISVRQSSEMVGCLGKARSHCRMTAISRQRCVEPEERHGRK